jgi:hypothetical protein
MPPFVQMGPRGRKSAKLGVEGAILLMDKIEKYLNKWLQIGLQADEVVTVR